ncbi:SDR family oxidoreductase [Calidifontibacter terrae]
MDVKDKTAVVTGAAGGIGAAIAAELITRGASVVLVDLDPAVRQTAQALGERAVAITGDVAATDVIETAITAAEQLSGPAELYFANAGIAGAPGLEATERDWDLSIEVNLRAHIRAAQLLIPQWTDRGAGYFVSTASAAGLLTQIGSATYAVTKHAAVAFAEWLSVTYGDQGVRVSCLCPMGVETALLRAGSASGDRLGAAATQAVLSAGEVLSPAEVASEVLAAVAAETFLILPHPQVRTMLQQKAADPDRWLSGMRRYQASLLSE